MPRKGENIYKRKDGRWEGRYIKGKDAEGSTKYGYIYAKTYSEAKEKLRDAIIVSRNRSEPGGVSESLLFSELAELWLMSVRSTIKDSTYNKYKNLLKLYLLPQLGSIYLCEITLTKMEDHCNFLLKKGGRTGDGLSPKTVSDALSIARSMCSFASKSGYTIPYDLKGIRIRQPPREMRIFSRNEQNKLCDYLYHHPDPINLGILVCLFTGMRVGEICGLHWEDISLEDQTFHVCRTLQRIQNPSGEDTRTKVVVTKPKSPCSIRMIPIPEMLIDNIKAHQKTKNGYFLTNSVYRYIEPRTMQNHFRAVLQQCKIPHANFHALRHTFATRCIELGFDVKSLSEILGHANVNITMNRYVHPSFEIKKENMNRLSVLFTV